MARRTGWAKLSKSYKARLVRSGVTREQWQKGADLRTARGHKAAPPSTAAPITPTMAMTTGVGTNADQRRLSSWRRNRAPSWLPSAQLFMADDVAAALSQLRNPKHWAKVDFYPQSDSQPWRMTVTYKQGYPQSITIPGGGASEVLQLISRIDPNRPQADGGPLQNFSVPRPGAWARWVEQGRNFDVHGTT
jgi:hypothetical protein